MSSGGPDEPSNKPSERAPSSENGGQGHGRQNAAVPDHEMSHSPSSDPRQVPHSQPPRTGQHPHPGGPGLNPERPGTPDWLQGTQPENAGPVESGHWERPSSAPPHVQQPHGQQPYPGWAERTQEPMSPHPHRLPVQMGQQGSWTDGHVPPHTSPMMYSQSGQWAMSTAEGEQPPEPPKTFVEKVQHFFKKHGEKMWWLHSFWAMSWGTFIVIYAQKGFHYARWLMLALFAAWFALLLSFRAAETNPDAEVDERKEKVKELVINYVLKNLYQFMLFFLLPWYYKSATLGRQNMYFVFVLAFCAIMATLDIVFDRFLMRVRILASIYYIIALFACLNLAIPAFAPLSPTPCLLLAAALSVTAVWFLHSPLSYFKSRRGLGTFAAVIALTIGAAWMARRFIPPVPLSIASGAVGPELLDDGRLKMEVSVLHYSMIDKMIGVTDLTAPSNTPSDMKHVWLQNGRLVARTDPDVREVSDGLLRVQSTLPKDKMPQDKTGDWHLQVETSAGQLVGEIEFQVIE